MRGMIIFKVLNMMTDSSPQSTHYEISAHLFKILTHPTRLAILDILRDGEHCVCHMEAHLGLRQAYISQQLSVLREAGLITDRRDGWNIFYRVPDPSIYQILDAAQAIVGETTIIVQGEVNCPCPKCRSLSKDL
jgi:ArsR family transcriptional regulator